MMMAQQASTIFRPRALPKRHASTRRPRDETAFLIGHVALNHSDRASLFDYAATSFSFFRFWIIFSLNRVSGFLPLNPFPDIRRTLTKFYAPPFLFSEEANHVEIHQCHLTQI